MVGLFDMVAFNIWNDPQVSRILAERVTRIVASLGAFEMFLARIFLGDAHGIEVKDIFIGFREPDDRFISSGKAAAAM